VCVIVCGAPWAGWKIYGPFADGIEAEEYQGQHLYGEDFWWIMPLAKEVCDE
jgi:hypothetical protein